MPHFDADQWSVLLITVTFGAARWISITDNRDLRRSALDRRRVCRSFANVSVGQNRKSSMRANVFRFAPESGHRAMQSACPLRATSGLMRRSRQQVYSITSSARRSLSQAKRGAAESICAI
jgi:hypothetical protein